MKVITFSLYFSLLLSASTAYAYNDPAQDIQQIIEKLSAFSKSKDKTNVVKIDDFLRSEIMPAFAFKKMAPWIAGPAIHHMNPDDINKFTIKLKTTFLESLAKHLANFNPDITKIQFLPTRVHSAGNAIVSLYVDRQNKASVKLGFRMIKENGHWKIFDVMANGFSAAIYYRQHFASWLQRFRHRP